MPLTAITDWRGAEDLPDIAPGDEYERVIAPQKFVVLHRILVRDMTLVRLQIGRVEDITFELESTDGPLLAYRLIGLGDDALKKALVATGATVTTSSSIAISPGLIIRVLLRNEGDTPVKPRAALLVQEEVT